TRERTNASSGVSGRARRSMPSSRRGRRSALVVAKKSPVERAFSLAGRLGGRQERSEIGQDSRLLHARLGALDDALLEAHGLLEGRESPFTGLCRTCEVAGSREGFRAAFLDEAARLEEMTAKVARLGHESEALFDVGERWVEIAASTPEIREARARVGEYLAHLGGIALRWHRSVEQGFEGRLRTGKVA